MTGNDRKPGKLFTRALAALLLAGGMAGAGEIESGIFEDGAHRRGKEYVRAREVLVQQGPKLIPFLQQQADSVDWRRLSGVVLLAPEGRPVPDAEVRVSLHRPRVEAHELLSKIDFLGWDQYRDQLDSQLYDQEGALGLGVKGIGLGIA